MKNIDVRVPEKLFSVLCFELVSKLTYENSPNERSDLIKPPNCVDF